jgi:zinc protease
VTFRFVTAAMLAACLGMPLRAQEPRQAPPPGGTPRDFHLPAGRTIQLANGMGATFVHYGTTPKAYVGLYVRAGNINEDSAETWLADLVGDLMKEGTTTRSAQQIAAAVSGMGGSLDISVGMDQSTFGGDVLSEATPEFIGLVADVVRNPSLPASELPRLKADRARELSVDLQDPSQITLARFRAALYPGHPYGRIFPTAEQLSGYTVEQMRAWHAANLGAARAHLYVVGRFDDGQAERAVRQAFGGWARGADPVVNPPHPRTGRELVLSDRPGAPQSTLYVGRAVADPSSPDWIAQDVTNALLGGAFDSRITANIREDKGYTYSPFSLVSARFHDAYWVETADVTTNVTGASLREIFHEIDRLRSEPPPAEELDGIKNFQAGLFVLRNSDRSSIARLLAFTRLHGLGREYLDSYVRRVNALTPREIQRIAQMYLDPASMLIVVTGDRSQITEQIAPYQRPVP